MHSDTHASYIPAKDTDSEDIDPINGVLIVVPVCSMVAAQQSSGLVSLMLRVKYKIKKPNEHKPITE